MLNDINVTQDFLVVVISNLFSSASRSQVTKQAQGVGRENVFG